MKKSPILSRKSLESAAILNEFLSRENEANKRKLQQMQIKVDESQTKEQGTLTKLQECIQIVEQGQFEKNEVLIISFSFRIFRLFS